MRLALFCHSLLSDWNHGNAHFLRGVVSELAARGHDVRAFEPRDAWSAVSLEEDHGEAPFSEVRRVYPRVDPIRYHLASLDLEEALDGADLVIVHEWSDPALVRRIGELRARGAPFRLLFHDTHHRAVSAPAAMALYDLSGYDGVLAFGAVLRDVYVARGWAARAWVWHEAADTRIFGPLAPPPAPRDLVFVGNYGDEERTRELAELVLEPVRALRLDATVYGVRYPEEGRAALAAAGVAYEGWLPNYEVPAAFARHRVTVHVPRRPYVEALRGIPTIRPFEALACGIPLVCATWHDDEHLFTPGRDFLVARDGEEMKRHLTDVLSDAALARDLRDHGRATILARHTCAHRVDELLEIAAELGADTAPDPARAAAPTRVSGGAPPTHLEGNTP